MHTTESARAAGTATALRQAAAARECPPPSSRQAKERQTCRGGAHLGLPRAGQPLQAAAAQGQVALLRARLERVGAQAEQQRVQGGGVRVGGVQRLADAEGVRPDRPAPAMGGHPVGAQVALRQAHDATDPPKAAPSAAGAGVCAAVRCSGVPAELLGARSGRQGGRTSRPWTASRWSRSR